MKIKISKKITMLLGISLLLVGIPVGVVINKQLKINSLVNLAEQNILNNRSKEAVEALQEAIYLNENRLDLYVMIEDIYQKEQQYEKLLDFYIISLESDTTQRAYLEQQLNLFSDSTEIMDNTTYLTPNTDVVLPEVITVEKDEVEFELPVTWDEQEVDTSVLGETIVTGKVESLNKEVSHRIMVGFKQGNDWLMLDSLMANSVYDGEDKVYYPSREDNGIYSLNLVDFQINKLDYSTQASEDMHYVNRYLNLYQNYLYFINAEQKELVKYNLKTNTHESISFELISASTKFRTINDKGYFLISTDVNDKEYSLYTLDLNNPVFRKELDINGHYSWIDYDGSIIAINDDFILERYDSLNDYQLNQSNIKTSGSGLLAIDKDEIYLEYRDTEDKVPVSFPGGFTVDLPRDKHLKVSKSNLNQKKDVCESSCSSSFNYYFVLDDILYRGTGPVIDYGVRYNGYIEKLEHNTFSLAMEDVDFNFLPVKINDQLLFKKVDGTFHYYNE